MHCGCLTAAHLLKILLCSTPPDLLTSALLHFNFGLQVICDFWNRFYRCDWALVLEQSPKALHGSGVSKRSSLLEVSEFKLWTRRKTCSSTVLNAFYQQNSTCWLLPSIISHPTHTEWFSRNNWKIFPFQAFKSFWLFLFSPKAAQWATPDMTSRKVCSAASEWMAFSTLLC